MASARRTAANLLVLSAIACGSGCERPTECTPGQKGCACAAGSTCSDASLACHNGTCIDALECLEGTLDCPCKAGNGCNASLTCSAGSCKSCPNDVAGCPCVAGACQSLVCDATSATCRPAKSCGDAGCARLQNCTPGTPTQDAVCLASCEPGYLWNLANGTCVSDPAATCTRGLNSIAQACESWFRECKQEAAGVHCGGCLSGYIEESGACRVAKGCDAQGCAAAHRSCTPPGPHLDASCGDCEPGFRISENQCLADPTTSCSLIQAACAAKNMLCVESESGAVCQGCKSGYLFDAAAASCRLPLSCATLPVPCGNGRTCREGTATTDAACYVPCPPCRGEGEDGSWPELTRNGKCICKTKPGYFYSLSGTTGTFPCDADGDGWVRDAARFSLEGDDPAMRANARCSLRKVNAFVLHNERGETLTVPIDPPISLYETIRNDDQRILNEKAGSNAVPVYGGPGGRALRAIELNSLTKACAGAMADFNDNGLADISEHEKAQPMVPADLVPLFQLYERFSYYVELHRGWYESSAGAMGRYHIREKSRLISAGDNFPIRYGVEESGAWTSDYWQTCPRSRDAWYEEGAPAVTMDFASLSGPGEQWKGMMHHSQFKCVKVVDDVSYREADRKTARHLQTASTLGDPPSRLEEGVKRRDYMRATPNSCAVQPASTDTGSGDSVDPTIRCAAKERSSVQVGQVLWAAVRIGIGTQFDRGCIFQCNGTPYLCPGSDPGSSSAQDCYYACGDMAASEAQVLGDSLNGYRVRGEVPMISTSGEVLGDPDAYQVRPPPRR